MGWEQRNGGGRYYVQKRREGQRVVSEYVGSGEAAQILADIDALHRQDRRIARAKAHEERAQSLEQDAPCAAFYQSVEAVLYEVLQAAGYHRPNRERKWRKKRMRKKENVPFQEPGQTLGQITDAQLQARRHEIGKAAQSVPEVCETLYTLYDRKGYPQEIVEKVANTATVLLHMEENLVSREAYRRFMDDLRAKLGADTSAPLERLLIERIVLCGYALHRAELRLTMTQKSNHTFAEGHYRDATVGRAHKRYLAAIKALAEVRKLKLPNVQVNIGEKQINVVQK